MFGSTKANWSCAFTYTSKKKKTVNQPRNDFGKKHICIVNDNTNVTYKDMEAIATNYFNARRGVPANTVVITNTNGFLEMDSWVAGNAKDGMVAIPVQNGAIFTYDAVTKAISTSGKTEILVTVKRGTDGRFNVDHFDSTGETAAPKYSGDFTPYDDDKANMIPWWMFGS